MMQRHLWPWAKSPLPFMESIVVDEGVRFCAGHRGGPRHGKALLRACLPVVFVCLSGTPAQADWSSRADSIIVETRDQVVLAVPATGTRFSGVTPWGHIALEVEQSESSRTHRVTMAGREFELETPADAPESHLAFDPRRRAFTTLLPSLRVELTGQTDLAPLADALGATGVTRFEPLGFAFIDLPEGLHPIEALEIIENLQSGYSATVRLPPLPVFWR